MLSGGRVGAVFPAQVGPKFNTYLSAKVGDGESKFVKPLDGLTAHTRQFPSERHYIVISVGGNDFRENLLNPIRLLGDVSAIQARYLQILDRIQDLEVGHNTIHPILMFQYRTDANNDPYGIYKILGAVGVIAAAVHLLCVGAIATAGLMMVAQKVTLLAGAAIVLGAAATFALTSKIVPVRVTKEILSGHHAGIAVIGALMEKFYKPMLERARRDRLPILDLPNAFDPHDRLYTSGIEPNKEGAARIAAGLANIIQQHDFNAPGKIYRETGAGQEIPQEWRVRSQPRQ